MGRSTSTGSLPEAVFGMLGMMLVVFSNKSLALISWEEVLYTDTEPSCLKKQLTPSSFGKYDTPWH